METSISTCSSSLQSDFLLLSDIECVWLEPLSCQECGQLLTNFKEYKGGGILVKSCRFSRRYTPNRGYLPHLLHGKHVCSIDHVQQQAYIGFSELAFAFYIFDFSKINSRRHPAVCPVGPLIFSPSSS
jgi:hypothetical protein